MRIIVAFVITAMLAGCSNPPASDADDGTLSVTTTTSAMVPAVNSSLQPALPSLSFADCRNQGGVFAMPRSAAVAVLPEGFEPVASTATTAPPDSVVLYAIAVECATYTLDNVTDGPIRFAYAELAVTPSASYKVAGLDDFTVPLAFIAVNNVVGAVVQSYGMGAAGAGSSVITAVEPDGTGASLQSFTLTSGGTLEFIFGAVAVDTLGVGTGDFALYGVQDKQVVSTVRGSATGSSASAHYSTAMFQATGIPGLEGVQDGGVGFAASGFDLAFVPLAAAMP